MNNEKNYDGLEASAGGNHDIGMGGRIDKPLFEGVI
jgi:hypothetical protein